jgi:DNA-binding CsgD family transcriptional regulator
MNNITLFRSKGLTDAESKVADKVAQGLRSKDIAAQLAITEKTVKFHLTKIYKKLDVNRLTLIRQFGTPDVQVNAEQTAADLLMRCVTLGRAGKPYAVELAELKTALEVAPEVKKVIMEA